MYITDDRVEKALRYLVESVDDYAVAVSARYSLEKNEKGLIALLMKESGQTSAAAQEREAYASEKYAIHVTGLIEAIKREKGLVAKREVEMLVIELWRTQQANNRAVERVR